MIRTLRVYFLTRQLREKVLLLGFILFATVWWLWAYSGRANRFWRDQRSTTLTLKEQRQWLDNRLSIETAAQKAASRLDPSQTLDRLRLASAVTQAANESGLRNTTSNPLPSQTNGQFTVHSVDFQAINANYEALLQFYLKLHKRAPYIGVEKFQLNSNANDESKLTLRLVVSAVEIPR